jgi:hypothetical protein
MASRSNAAKKVSAPANKKAAPTRRGTKSVSKTQAPAERSAAAKPAKVRAAAEPAGTPLSDAQLLKLARAAVPPALRDGGVVRRPARLEIAMARAGEGEGQPSLDDEVAKLVGATLPPVDLPTATVEFVSETELGKRNTVVHLRGHEVTRVITRAAR